MLFGNTFLGGARWSPAPRLGVFRGQSTVPVETPPQWASRTKPLNLPEENVTRQISQVQSGVRNPRRRR